MTTIVLDAETADRVLATPGPVTLLHPDGRTVLEGTTPGGPADPAASPPADPVWSAEEIAAIERRSAESRARGEATVPAEEAYRQVFGEGWRERYAVADEAEIERELTRRIGSGADR